MNDEIHTIKAVSIKGRTIGIFNIRNGHPADFIADQLNKDHYRVDGEHIIDQYGESVASIESIVADDDIEFRDFSTENEQCMSLDDATDHRLECQISDLRGLIDGQQDGLGSVLIPMLGYLLAEQGKRARQRTNRW